MKLFSCSTHLGIKFQHLIKTKMLKNKDFLSNVVLILLINVKMPTIVDILTFMSGINSCLVELSMKKSFITLGSG